MIEEGGASGHMSHPYDYNEFTLRNLKGMIRNLFSGKIEDITEKIDGTNIQATKNLAGEVVFIRNKGDLNSARGGMSIQDMATKWADRPRIAKTFTDAGEIISKVFASIPVSFFNPDNSTRRVLNCECVTAGRTNIMIYPSAQVDFHNIWVYRLAGPDGWSPIEVTRKGMDVISKACKGIDSAMPTPNVVIRYNTESKIYIVRFIKELDKIWKDAGLGERNTTLEYKKARYYQLAPDWIKENPKGTEILFNRWFMLDESVNLRELKSMYADHLDELVKMDKSGYRDLTWNVMQPYISFIRSLGVFVSDMCGGLINSNTGSQDAAISHFRKEIDDTIDFIKVNGTENEQDKVSELLKQLHSLGDSLPHTEGIVFSYKGKLMKLTGSFAVLNQLLNLRYMHK